MTVPAECWKVLVVVPQRPAASDELAEVDAGARVIAVIMPNDELHVDSNWTAYRTSTQIERRTGYHFFDRLPPDVVDVLRRRVDQTPVAPARTRR